MLYCMGVYQYSRSTRSFNNWLFDYILPKQPGNISKRCGIQWLLLDFKDSQNTESLMTCLDVFSDEIVNSPRLLKISLRIRSTLKY